MKILKKIIIILLILVVIVLVIAALLPSKRHIEASITLNTPASSIYEQVVNFRNWDKWMPFKEGDTAMKSTYEGAPKGVGAIMKWESKTQGNGVMTILEAIKNKSIRTNIDFEGQGSSLSEWKFEEDSNKTTKVTWSLDMDHLTYPVGRIMGLVMQSVVTKSFEKGLANLKKVSEEYFKAVSTYKTTDIQIKKIDKQFAIVIMDSSKCDEVDIMMGKDFDALGRFIGENKIEITGAPFARAYLWDEKANRYVAEIGFPVKNKVQDKGNIRSIELPATKVVSAIHNGSYETTGFTHMAIDKYIKDNKLVVIGIPMEIYLTDMTKEPDMTKWKTEIVYPVK
ncbi:MAG: SRPBCC family protein [Bacteroidota bacterium]